MVTSRPLFVVDTAGEAVLYGSLGTTARPRQKTYWARPRRREAPPDRTGDEMAAALAQLRPFVIVVCHPYLSPAFETGCWCGRDEVDRLHLR